MERICIYVTYDPEGIVDGYISYILKELKTCIECLIVVSNNGEIVCGREILEKYAEKVFYRENKGFDAGAFKDTLCTFIGWETVLRYDELILVNDSMFGPFRPMKDIFREMDQKSVDFWGLTKHRGYKKNGYEGFEEHIQSFFLTIRTDMLHSDHFRSYWENMPYYESYDKVVREYEMKFTAHFFDLGYKYDVLADMDANDSDVLENNYIQFETISYELIKKRNFPFLKKQQISYNTLDKQTQENLRQAIAYIDEETDYDINLIWDNIIRTLNISDLQRSLHFQYIIPPGQGRYRYHIAVVIFVSHKDAAQYVLEYLQRLDRYQVIKIITHDYELMRLYQEQGYMCELIEYAKFLKSLVPFRVYDLVCILHDVDMTSKKRYSCIGKSYFYNIWENLIKNKEHVQGIQELFEKEKRLGFIAPPQPNFSGYFGEIGKGWGEELEGVCNVVKRLNIHCQISEEIPPFCVSDDFWIRGCVLKRLEDMKEEDFQYLPYLWGYLAQDAGYYAGVVESMDYASMNEVNMHYYMSRILDRIRQQYGGFEDIIEMEKILSRSALREFCEKYPRIFIYGTGYTARRYRDILSYVEAYIVSDGEVKEKELDGIPIKFLSEITMTDDCGIIVCLKKRNMIQVKKLLRERGIGHYLCM